MKIRLEEDGLVAILVTVIILTIITITTLGMAQIARHEQRQTVDRQLSAQALLAAESGVNDAIETLKTAPATISTDCSTSPTTFNSAGNNVSLPNTVATTYYGGISASSQYTCVLLDNNPKSLEYSNIDPNDAAGGSAVANIDVPVGSISQLVIGWEDPNPPSQPPPFRAPPNCSVFPKAGSWNSAALLKVDITDLQHSGFSRNNLISYAQTYYLSPCDTGASNSWGTQTYTPGVVNSGAIVSGAVCDSSATHAWSTDQPLRCNVHISIAPTSNNILVRIKPIYGAARVTVEGCPSPTGIVGTPCTPLGLHGAQTVVDVTGKAADVVKRLQVRYSNTSSYLYALESVNSICKRLEVTPTGTTANLTGVNGPPPATPNDDQSLCAP